jgi:GNAT superfamily N-acetyltransferase
MKIRRATPADLAPMLPLINAAFSVESFLEGPRADELQLSRMADKGAFLVAEDAAGELLASVYVELRGSVGYFGMLAVDPGQQGHGIGRALVAASEAYFRDHGCAESEILVLSLRPELLPFYEKLGYMPRDREPFVPSRKMNPRLTCDSIIMMKGLA